MTTDPTAVTPVARRRLLWAKRLLLSAVALLVSLLLVEAGLRLFGHEPKLTQPSYLAGDNRVAHDELIMISRRFLDERTYRVEEGATVIVTIGDSFTVGWPVASTDSYPQLLEEKLEGCGWDVDVLNFGQSNTGSDQHLRLLEDYVLPRIKPDIVVWALYSNDVGDNIRQPVFDLTDGALVPLDGSKHWLHVRQNVHDAVPGHDSLRENCRLFQVFLKSLEFGELPVNPENLAWSVRKIEAAVKRLSALAETHGFDVCYALIVPQAIYLYEANPQEWQDHFVVRDHALLHGALSGAPDVLELRFPRDEAELFASAERDSSSRGNRHFQELGYALMAEAIAERLLERYGERPR